MKFSSISLIFLFFYHPVFHTEEGENREKRGVKKRGFALNSKSQNLKRRRDIIIDRIANIFIQSRFIVCREATKHASTIILIRNWWSVAKVGTNREYFSLRVLGVLDGFIKGESSSTPRFSSHREIFPRIFFHELLSSLSVFATILRLFRVVITTKYFRKSTLPFPRIISLRKALCVYTYIYTRLYLYIDGERGCVRVHKRKSSRAISAITSASAQTLPFFRRH